MRMRISRITAPPPGLARFLHRLARYMLARFLQRLARYKQAAAYAFLF